MQQLSFDSKNQIFSLGALTFAIQVFTFENLYEPDPSSTTYQNQENSCLVCSDSFVWAGGQEKANGWLRIEGKIENGVYYFHVQAEHKSENIRCTKLIIKNVPLGSISNLRQPYHQSKEFIIPMEGTILKYPDGFTGLYTPLVVVKLKEEKYTYFRSLDNRVRPKVFAMIPMGDTMDVELIFEECARKFSHFIDVPTWEIGFSSDYETIMEKQKTIIQDNYGLQSWESRTDVPHWAKEISLVASIHCQHWTGYIFNNYDDVIKNLQTIGKKVDPHRVLAYLPGWEGRYYYQYGDFRPCPRLGGEKGFQKLMDAVKEMGMHVMPMFMINGANPHLENFWLWGQSSLYYSPSGFPQIWGSCDWDSSRHYDHNCGFPLNPGAPLWQDRLVGQVLSLIDRYGFDGVFMDLAAVYINDPRYDTYEATIQIANRIRENHPEILMAGEGWYDAISLSMPLTQPSLSLDGDCRWSDRPYEKLFNEYNRCFAHLGTGDVSRGSTGVFEFGNNLMTQQTPLRKGIIPTISIVDGTLQLAPDKADMIFDQANEYTKKFLLK